MLEFRVFPQPVKVCQFKPGLSQVSLNPPRDDKNKGIATAWLKLRPFNAASAEFFSKLPGH
jgi:hypothetical protein